MTNGQHFSMPPGERWLPVHEAAGHIGVSVDILLQWVSQGRIASVWRDTAQGPLQYVQIMHPVVSATEQSILGREAELAAISSALAAAADGNGRLIMIGGEAGIGKTTLVNASARLAEEAGFAVLYGHSYDIDNPAPYSAWQTLLQSARINERLAPPDELLDANLQNPDGGPSQIHSGLEHYILEAATCMPLLIIMEDQHWSDQAGLDLLRVLARRITAAPVVIMLTFRDIELSATQPLYLMLPRLVRESAVLRLNLTALDERAVHSLLQQRYRLSEDDNARLSAYIWQYAEGNPFFTEELAFHLEHEGALHHVEDHWVLGELPEFRVPPLIRQVINRRLELLSSRAVQLLEVAAVIGTEVPLDLWQLATSASSDELANCIDEALRARLLVEIPPYTTVRFRHALIREALYDGLQIIRRRAQHRNIAELLADETQPVPGLVAHHFRQAHDPRALDWLLLAGRNAALASEYRSAIPLFEQAMEILVQQPHTHADQAWLACELSVTWRYVDAEQALRYIDQAMHMADGLDDSTLQAVILWIRSHIRGFLNESALPELYAASAAFQTLTDEDYERIYATSLAFVISRGTLAHRFANHARFKDAHDVATEILNVDRIPATRQQHHDAGTAHLSLGIAYAHLGMPADALASFARAREHLRQVSNHFLVGRSYALEYRHGIEVYYPERVQAREYLIKRADLSFQRSAAATSTASMQHERIFGALILSGRWDEAQAAAEGLLGSRYMRVESSEVLAELAALRGQSDLAWTHIDRAIPDGSSAEPSNPFFHEVVNVQRIAAELALQQGQLDLALAWMRAHQRWTEWAGSLVGKYVRPMLLAAYQHALGEPEAALEHARRATQLAQEPRQPLGLLRAERLVGQLTQQLGHADDAVRHLGLALDLARSIQAPYEIALSEIAYARHLLASGQRADASALLADARDTLTSLGVQPALVDIANIEALSDTSDDTGPVAGLSAREIEVLRLVAHGMTDAEIGDTLYISRRTVNGHVRSIFSKCDVSSRAAATAFAYEHSLITPGE